MKKSTFSIPFLFCLLLIGGVMGALSQKLDISSGGTPTITGALSGSVTGSSNVLNDLVVTINFGEVSPANTNSIIKVVVPIAVRSDRAYKVVATITGGTNANTQAVQKADIGFGLTNWRAMGTDSRVCTNPHIFAAPFNTDPSTGVSTNASGRVIYTSDLSDIGAATTILTGPRLSNGIKPREVDDGYIFDAIFTLTPQFFATGTTSAVITFTISNGPASAC